MQINILVTCGGGFQGLAVAKELNALPSVKIFLADYYEENVTKYFSHKSIKAVPVADPGIIHSLIEISTEENVRTITP